MSFVRRDITRFYYPMWHHGVEQLKQGHIPLWNPYINFGQPFFASLQTCVFYPLAVIFFLPDFTWAFNFYIIFHLALAGFFTTIWMRSLRVSWGAAVLSGLAFSLGAYMISSINLTIALCSAAYFPLALFFFRKAVLTSGFFWKSICGICLFVQYLAGDPSISIATILVLIIFTVYQTFLQSIKARKPVLGPLWDLWQIGGVLLLLSAFQTLLFGEFILLSLRAHLDKTSKTVWSMLPMDLVSLGVPFFSDLSIKLMGYFERQSWLDNYYLGVTTIALAVMAVILRKKSALVGYHVLLALLGLGMALGSNSLMYSLLQRIFPLLNFIRYPVRFFFMAAFSIACLAGFGFDALLASGPEKRGRRNLFAVSFLVFLSSAVLLFALFFDPLFGRLHESLSARFGDIIKKTYYGNEFNELVYATLSNLKRSALFFGLSLFGILAAYFLRIRRSVLSVYFILLLIFDLSNANLVEPLVENRDIARLVPNVRQLLKDAQPRLFRIIASPYCAFLQQLQWGRGYSKQLTSMKNKLTPDFMMFHKLYDCLGYDSVYLQRTSEFQHALHRLRPTLKNQKSGFRDFELDGPVLDMLNVKYYMSTSRKLPGNFKRALISRTGTIYMNPKFLPRAFLVKNYAVEMEPQLILKNIFSRNFDPLETVYLDEKPPNEPVLQTTPESLDDSQVSILDYEPERIKMEATVGSKGRWLFLSDTYYPGWKATVDGKPTKIYRANYAFRAIRLSPGSHEIVWRYDPILFKIGTSITLMTILGLGVYYFRRRNALV